MSDAVVIEKIFEAPIELIWKLWTEPELFQKWYGPNGFSIPAANMDVRVGGKRLICMEMPRPDGSMQMWFTGKFKEVVPNERLVYTDSMSDEQGNPIPPEAMGMPEGTPAVTEVTVQLEDLDSRTKMVMTHAGVPADSGGAGGWAQAFAKLDALIPTLLR